MRITGLLSTTTVVALVSTLPANAAGPYFERVATLPVYATLPEGTDPKTATSAEIATATAEGVTLIFTDSPGKRIGFVDIADPTAREPDAIGWLGEDRLVTANEGDYEGGSRGFTVFDAAGKVLRDSRNLLEHLAMSHGRYPVKRAKSKGVEPEGVEVASFGDQRLIFVNSERGNFVAVFTDKGVGNAPEFLQFLPSGVGPEGLIAIPSRELLAVGDARSAGGCEPTGAVRSIMQVAAGVSGNENGRPKPPVRIKCRLVASRNSGLDLWRTRSPAKG